MALRLNNFDIVKECKGNRHNKIYLLNHKETGKKYILKIISIYQKESQLREIEIHKTLSHKYIISLIKHQIVDDSILMLIEYAKHGDLYSFLPKLQDFSERKVLKIFYKILKSIEYLHQNNYIHRDIKPENILITNNLRPKLADFGTSVNQQKVANTFCGTYEYMAPEVYLRKKQTDKIDVWAVGILLYEITHRKTPFKHKELDEIKRIIDNKSIEFKRGFSPLMIDFIYSCIKFDSKQRPSITKLLEHEMFDSIKNKDIMKRSLEEKRKEMPLQRELPKIKSQDIRNKIELTTSNRPIITFYKNPRVYSIGKTGNKKKRINSSTGKAILYNSSVNQPKNEIRKGKSMKPTKIKSLGSINRFIPVSSLHNSITYLKKSNESKGNIDLMNSQVSMVKTDTEYPRIMFNRSKLMTPQSPSNFTSYKKICGVKVLSSKRYKDKSQSRERNKLFMNTVKG